MSKLTFNINNGDKQVWEQHEHDGNVHLYRLEEEWEKNSEIVIPPGEMVMLANMYREVKRLDVNDVFVNSHGGVDLKSGDSVTSAIEKQIPKKPIAFKRTVHDFSTGECPHSHSQCEHIKCYNHEYEYTDYRCPVCGALTKDGTPNYCWNCGQALDWSDTK